MERLTCWLAEGAAGIAPNIEEQYKAEEVIDILALRLAAYEDTGFTPEEIEGFDAGLLAAYKETGLEPEEIALYKEAEEISESMAPGMLIELSQPNELLTQKQLQFMSGDPVWIVREDGADRWALIRYANSGGIGTYGCGYLSWGDLGKTWFAYCRPPKED